MNLGLQRGKVELVEHDRSWQQIFLEEKEKLQEIFGERVLGIEHIGSTAIKDIKAKPILDLMIGVEVLSEPENYMEDLQKLGYIFRKDSRLDQQHILFVKGPEEKRTHYLKVAGFDSDFWREHLAFRDFLNNNPQYRQEYEELKLKLLEDFQGDRVPYTEGKAEFIKKILELAGYSGEIL